MRMLYLVFYLLLAKKHGRVWLATEIVYMKLEECESAVDFVL